MNLSLPRIPALTTLTTLSRAGLVLDDASTTRSASEDSAHVRRLRSLLSLFALYAGALFAVILFSDGPDIGCILMGIAGHVIYASVKTALSWREAAWFEAVQRRVRAPAAVSVARPAFVRPYAPRPSAPSHA